MIREYMDKDFNPVSIIGRDITLDYVFKLSPAGKCYVYELGKDVVGFAIVDLLGDRSELIDLCVAPLYRHKGIGNELLNKVIEVSKENKCESVTLEVKIDNTFAINLYKKNQFRIANIRKKYYNNGSIDAYVMQRELG